MPKSSLMIAVVTGVLPDSRKKKEKRTSVDLSTKKVGVLFWSPFLVFPSTQRYRLLGTMIF